MMLNRLNLEKPDSVRLHLGTITIKEFKQLAVNCGVVVQRCAAPEERFRRTRVKKRRFAQAVAQTASELVFKNGSVGKKKSCGRRVGTGGAGGISTEDESKRDEVKARKAAPAKRVPKPFSPTSTKKVVKGTLGRRFKKGFPQASGAERKKKIPHCFFCGKLIQKRKAKKGKTDVFCGPCGIQMNMLELLYWKPGGDSESQQTNDTPMENSGPMNPAPLEDPLSEVNAVRQQIQEAEKRVERFQGDSKDQEYKVLDELFTQFLIKLDTIETGGCEDVRNARKQCVLYIQQCIAKLEKKDGECVLFEEENLTIPPPPSNNFNGNHATDNNAIAITCGHHKKLVKDVTDEESGGKKQVKQVRGKGAGD